MAQSLKISPQMQMLSQQQRDDIMVDYMRNPNPAGGMPTLSMHKTASTQVPIMGPVLDKDTADYAGAMGPLTRAQMQTVSPQEEVPEAQGALSRVTPVAPSNQPPDIAAMLKQYMPEDDSRSHYLALAAGFAAPTKTGSFGEQLGNVASAMQQQRAEQDKMRAQYVPLIMQQVAAQQAREEQAKYRLEAQQQAQAAQAQAAQQAQAARADQERLAQQARTDNFTMMEAGRNERATADRALREQLATDKMAAFAVANPVVSVQNPTPILGVPVPRVLPWANQSNAKDADKVRLAEIARGAKEVESDADAAKKAQALAQEGARFKVLNAQTGTGGLADRIPGGQFVQSFGDNYNEMQTIASRLTPSMREAGSGATSDFDARMFQRGTVGVDKPKEVNDVIATGLIKRAQLAQDYADFRSTYLEQNGTLTGANEHWNKYVKAHPIFDPAKPNVPALNADRVEWRDYFSGAPANAQPATPTAQPDRASAARAEIAARAAKGAK